jgi:hypothetical protein
VSEALSLTWNRDDAVQVMLAQDFAAMSYAAALGSNGRGLGAAVRAGPEVRRQGFEPRTR